MKKITIFDTSVATTNVGDEIIVDAVENQLNTVFENNSMFFHVPTHEKLGYVSYKIINQSDVEIVAGTNLLSSNYRFIRPNSWRISFKDLPFIGKRNVVLMGVGWANYEKEPSFFTKLLYRKLLSNNLIHSVRDNYTLKKLNSIGINNVINTGCATLWNLTPEFCKNIPSKKAEHVIFTLTDYRKNPEADQKLIDILEKNYNRVLFWPQGAKDYEYINTLKSNKVEIINPTLKSFDEILSSTLDIDYIGTRLHGGIRALQNHRRTIIIGVDNRALEMKKDVNLPVLEIENISQLSSMIINPLIVNIQMDYEKINKWKSQFENENG